MSDQEVPLDSSFYVYGLIDPRTNLPFYIGKGKGKRAESHIAKVSNGRTSENKRKDARIKELLDLGLKTEITKYMSDLTEIAAYQHEGRLIREFGRYGFEADGILLNVCFDNRTPLNSGRTRFPKGHRPWNQGQVGVVEHSTETKLQMSKSRQGYQNALGTKHSEESKRTRSDRMKGKDRSEETKAKIRASCKAAYLARINASFTGDNDV